MEIGIDAEKKPARGEPLRPVFRFSGIIHHQE
jgi:hypothetical protein